MEIAKSNVNTSDKFDISDLELKLLNMVCATLIHEPSYYSTADENKTVLTALVNQVASYDAEFIFKLAFYVRDDLNIRSTANFLLSLAANNKSCHPHFRKYFSAIIRLPSDLLEVVTLFMQNPDKYLSNKNSIPTPLRKAASVKFPEFDAYQLAKYNKENAQKKRVKKAKEKESSMEVAPKRRVNPRLPPKKEPKEIKKTITLKQLIRKIHLDQPAEPVMSILGKKYPIDVKSFNRSGLPGVFDPERIGKRMRLPTPETWETLLSSKGNKSDSWQELIDHKKLPFMAMLRNLRNLIITGISPQHHEIILNRLTDEKSITNSRQLPWRFLSAYEAINVDLEKMMNDILDNDGSSEKIITVQVKGKKGREMGLTRQIKKKVIIPVHMPDIPLIAKYREAIDTAIRLSTMHNIKPIEGNTVVFCDVSGSMKCKCSSKGNMGSIQEVREIAILLGLMLQDVCEECDFRIFSSPGNNSKGRCDLKVELDPNTILNNIKRVEKEAEKLGGGTDFPFAYLDELIAKKVKIDTFIILSDMMIAPGKNEMNGTGRSVTEILHKYRTQVNPNLLFVAMDLNGNGTSIVDVDTKNPKEILITGFSDNVLRFIAESGNLQQLEYVRNIDKIKFENNNNFNKKPKGKEEK